MVDKTRNELKKGMALPPILAAKSSSRRGRDRNRIRIEVQPKYGEKLLELIGGELKKAEFGSEDYHGWYTIYRNVKLQVDKKS